MQSLSAEDQNKLMNAQNLLGVNGQALRALPLFQTFPWISSLIGNGRPLATQLRTLLGEDRPTDPIRLFLLVC